MTVIPKAAKMRLMRLISARADVDYAIEAYRLLLVTEYEPVRYHFFVSMVMAYNRPFTENEGIGSLRNEYPNYPDFTDLELNARHRRMVDMRNKFLGHSSVQGTQAVLLAPGAINPGTSATVESYSYAVAKLQFLHKDYVEWFGPLLDALSARLNADLDPLCAQVGEAHLPRGETYELDSRHEDFTWSVPKP